MGVGGGAREGRGGGKGECGTKTGHSFQRVDCLIKPESNA